MHKLVLVCFSLFIFSQMAFAQQAKIDYDKFLDQAFKSFEPSATKLDKEYKLAKYSWSYSQDSGKLVFSENGVVKVIATAQIVGSYSTYSNTWMWSWANKSVDDSVKKDIVKVKEYGEKNQFKELTTAQWKCDQDYAWIMTAVASHLLKAKGAYRGPYPDGFAYFMITDIKWAEAKNKTE